MSTQIIVIAACAGLLVVILLMIVLYKRRMRLSNSRMLNAIKVQVSSNASADGSTMIADFLQSDLDPDLDPDKSTPTSSLRRSDSSGTISTTGIAALERARAHRESKGDKSSLRRSNSWGRLGVRRTPSFKRDHQVSESASVSPPSRVPAHELADDLETQLMALGQKKSPPSSPKVASTAGPGSMHTMPSGSQATAIPPVAAVAAVATQSESISNPSDSRGGTPPVEAAPASEPLPSAPDGTLTARIDAHRELVGAHAEAAKESSIRLSNSSGQLAPYASAGPTVTPSASLGLSETALKVPPTEELLAAGTRQLRPSSSCPEDPLSPRSPRSPVTRTPTAPPATHVGAARADTSDQSGTSGSGSGKPPGERKRCVRPTADPTEQGRSSNVRLPRRSLKQSWPPESSPAARSGISSSSLMVDRV